MNTTSVLMRKTLLVSILVTILFSCQEPEPSEKKFSIQGSVTEKGVGVAGVSILLNGSKEATTGVSGSFAIEGLSTGNYVVKAQELGKTFSPDQIDIPITNGNVTGANFERTAIDQLFHQEKNWTLFNAQTYSIRQNTTSLLQLDLIQNALWYQGSQGGLIYVTLSGNFTMSATVNAVRKTDNTKPVACEICLGGLMVRNTSTTNGENYVHLVTGFTPNGLGYEYKSTINSVSDYTAIGDGEAMHDLRIQRIGSSFMLSQKLPDATNWNIVATVSRPDLPANVMVGINIYTAQNGLPADLSVIYKGIKIEN